MTQAGPPAPPKPVCLSLQAVSAGYGRTRILTEVNLSVHRGELLVLVGPNGSGKSTLLRVMAGLLGVRNGEVHVDGLPRSASTARRLARRIAYLPQQRDIPPMTVKQLVESGRYPHRGLLAPLTEEDRHIVCQSLVTVGLANHAERSLSQLSGGERQKAYLAMLVAQQADILLLDEPTVHLDPGAQLELLEIIASLCRSGHTIVTALHDLGHALRIADRIAVVRPGRPVIVRPPGDLLSDGLLDDTFGIRIHALQHEDRLFPCIDLPRHASATKGETPWNEA